MDTGFSALDLLPTACDTLTAVQARTCPSPATAGGVRCHARDAASNGFRVVLLIPFADSARGISVRRSRPPLSTPPPPPTNSQKKLDSWRVGSGETLAPLWLTAVEIMCWVMPHTSPLSHSAPSSMVLRSPLVGASDEKWRKRHPLPNAQCPSLANLLQGLVPRSQGVGDGFMDAPSRSVKEFATSSPSATRGLPVLPPSDLFPDPAAGELIWCASSVFPSAFPKPG